MAKLTVAWGKRSAAPGKRNAGHPLAESQTHPPVNETGDEIGLQPIEWTHSPTWGGAALAPGYGVGWLSAKRRHSGENDNQSRRAFCRDNDQPPTTPRLTTILLLIVAKNECRDRKRHVTRLKRPRRKPTHFCRDTFANDKNQATLTTHCRQKTYLQFTHFCRPTPVSRQISNSQPIADHHT